VSKEKLILESAIVWTAILALIIVLDIMVKIVIKFLNPVNSPRIYKHATNL